MNWKKISLERKCFSQPEMDSLAKMIFKTLDVITISTVPEIIAHKTLRTKQIALVNNPGGNGAYAVEFEKVVDGDVDYTDFCLKVNVYFSNEEAIESIKDKINNFADNYSMELK